MRIGIPVYDGVDMLDVAGPFEMFDWAGFDVEVVAENIGEVRFRGRGFSFNVDRSFEAAGQYDVIWVPGGDPKVLADIIEDDDSAYLKFLTSQADGARYMCAVCEGSTLLAATGLLDGYRATTHWAFKDCFPGRFPNVTIVEDHPRFILDRDRLTGGGISSGLDEALELIRLLAGEAAARQVQLTTQYYPDPPVTGKIPETPPKCPIPFSSSP